MATITRLSFNIVSNYNGSGTRAATRGLLQVQGTANAMNSSLGRSSGAFQALSVAAAALAPALAPIATVATGVGAATVAMAVSSGSALTVYGAAMAGAIKRTFDMAEAGKRLDASQQSFISSVDAMKGAWDRFIQSTSPATLTAATTVVQGITAGIGRLKPVVDAVAPSVQRVAEAFRNWAAGDGLQRFINVIITHGVPALNSLLNAGRHVLATLGIGFRTFAPEGVKLAQALERGAAAMRGWAENGGFTRFLQTVNQHAPQVRQFFDALGGALRNVSGAMAGLGPLSLSLAIYLLRIVAALPPSWIQAIVIAFVAWRSAMLGLLIINTIVTIVKALQTAILALRTAWFLLNLAFAGTPIGLIIMGVVALVAGIVYLATQTRFFQTVWNVVWAGVRAAAEAVWNALRAAWNAFVNALVVTWNAVSGALRAAWAAVWGAVRATAEAVWNALRAVWAGFISGLSATWNAVSGALRASWDAVWNGLRAAAEAVWNAIRAGWNAVVNGLKAAWDIVSAVLRAAWDAAWNGIRAAGEAVWNALLAAWNAVINAIKTSWDVISAVLRAAWDAVWNGIRAAGEAVWNALLAAWNAVINAIKMSWDVISTVLRAAWDAFWNAVRAVAEAIWNAMRAAWQAFLDAVRAIYNAASEGLRAAWNAFWDGVRATAAAVWGVIRDGWDKFLSGVRAAADAFIGGLKKAFSDCWNAIKDTANKVWHEIGEIIERAINGVVGIINRLIGAFNNITGFLQIDVKLGEIPTVDFNFAHGGVVPGAPKNLRNGGTLSGYSPGRDTVPAMLSPGEGVLTPEAVRGLGGPGFVHSANRQFAGHRGAGRGAAPLSRFRELGFAQGGMVPVQHFGVGGMTAAALVRAGVPLSMVTQGEYSDGSLSAGTHLGGGAVDIASADPAILTRLIGAGFAAWIRTPAQGFAYHIHAVLMNHPDLSPAAAAQVQSFLAGGTGLGVGGGGGGGGGNPFASLIGKLGEILRNVALGKDPLDGLFGDGGGFLGDMFRGLSRAFSGMLGLGGGGPLGGLGKMLLGAVTGPMLDKAFDFVEKMFGDNLPGGGFGKIATGIGRKVLDVAKKFILGKAKESAFDPSMLAAGGAGVQQWAGLAAEALARAGLDMGQLPAFLALMQKESGGNPFAVNTWDSNAAMGQASSGLMQVIPSTFAAFRDPSLPNNLFDPLANMTAAARYIRSRYGGVVPGSPYFGGTTNARRGWHLVGENGPEWRYFRGGEQVMNTRATQRELRRIDGGGGVVFEKGAFQIDARGASVEAVREMETNLVPKLRLAVLAGVGRRG